MPDNLENLGEFVARSLSEPSPPWIIENFIPVKGMTIIAGRPKRAKKSWLAYLMAMCAASGKSTNEFKVPRPVKVLFFSREGAPVKVAERFIQLERGTGIKISDCGNLFWVQNGNWWLDDEKHVKQVIAWIDTLGVELVVWDTFARSFRGNENDARDVGAALRGVEAIRDAGAATLLVHHLGKGRIETLGGTADPDAGLRGSSALAGAYDVICSIQEHTIDGTFQQIMISGGKYDDFKEYGYDWHIDDDKAYLRLDGPREPSLIEEPNNNRARF